MKIKYSAILFSLLLTSIDATRLASTGDSFSDMVAQGLEARSKESDRKVSLSMASLPGDKDQPFADLSQEALKRFMQNDPASQDEETIQVEDEHTTDLTPQSDEDDTLGLGDMFTIRYKTVREALLSEPSKVVHGLVKSADDRLSGLDDFAAAQADRSLDNDASDIAGYLSELGVSAEEYRSRAEEYRGGPAKTDLVYAWLVKTKSIPNAYPLIRRYEPDAQGVFDALSVVYGDVLGDINSDTFNPCNPESETNPACRIDALNVAVIGARQSFKELQDEATGKTQGTTPIALYNKALASYERQSALIYLLDAMKAYLASGKKAPLTLLDTIDKLLEETPLYEHLNEEIQKLVQTAKEEIKLASNLYSSLWHVEEDDEQGLEQAIEDFEDNYPLNPEDYPAKHLLNHYHLCQLKHGDEQDCYLFVCAIHHADKSTSALSTTAYGQCIQEFKEQVHAIPAPPGPLKDFLEATHTWSWIAKRQAEANVKLVLEKVAEGEQKLRALEQELLAIQEAQIRRGVPEDFAKIEVEQLLRE